MAIEGVRFYLEPSGDNAVAIEVDQFHMEYAMCEDGKERLVKMYDGYGAVFYRANSPVASTGVSSDYLRDCKPISEDRARDVHPALFDYLDMA